MLHLTPPATPLTAVRRSNSPHRRYTLDPNAGSDFVLDGAEFARSDCPLFLCGSVINHPPESCPPNTAFLALRVPVTSAIMAITPPVISYDPSALYFSDTPQHPTATEVQQVPIVALVTIRPVLPLEPFALVERHFLGMCF